MGGACGLEGVETRDLSGPLSFEHLGLADGLPQGSATAIVQDRLGYIWIGTEDGLARYDGYNLRVFRSTRDDPTTLIGNWITSLAIGPDGRLWAGTHAGASVYDPDTDEFSRLTLAPAEDSDDVGGIHDIHAGEDEVWLARMQGGLAVVDPETLDVRLRSEPPLDSTITSMSRDDAGRFWLGTDLGLIVYDPAEGVGEKYLPEDESLEHLSWATVTATYLDSIGRLWVGTEGQGLYVLDARRRALLRHHTHAPDDARSLSGDHITGFLEDQTRRMWVGTQTGLNRTDENTGAFVKYGQDSCNPRGLPGPHIESLYQDRGGVVWVGTNGHGVALFDELRLSFGHQHTTATTGGLYQDDDGTIWAGTGFGSGLYKFDPSTQSETRYQALGTPGEPDFLDLSRVIIWALHRTGRDTLWLGTMDHGLIRFNTETEAFRRYTSEENPDLESDWIWGFWEASDGKLWLATWGGGLAVFDPEQERFSSLSDLHGLSSNHIYTIYEDPIEDDLLWLGTGEGGVCRLRLVSMAVDCFQSDENDPDSIAGNDVTGVYRASDGSLWLTTHSQGLSRLDPSTGQAVHFHTENSPLESDALYAIRADEEERLWVSSANGLYRVNPTDGAFVRYDASDGLQSAEFTLLAAHKGGNGELLFGGVGGFNVFDPGDIQPDDYAPPVVITDFHSLGRDDIALDSPIWTRPEIDVSYTSSFEFEFAALAFANPDGNRLAYKLEGFDAEWIEGRRFARYSRLSGGDYTLRVRAANRHGVWSEEDVELSIRVAPAPWRTWWAYSLYALTLLGGLAGYRRYTQQKVVRIEEKSRLAAVERDLELTGAVQHGFLPRRNSIEGSSVRIHGYYRPAEACGGDWWWHEEPARGRHHVLVGDVTGHGPGPAMVTAAVGAAFRVQTRPLAERLDVLNQEVLVAGQGKYHMTMAALELDENQGTFTYYSAGSTPILRLKQGAATRALPCRGTPLGSERFQAGCIEDRLERGERLLVYTDGIPELLIAPDRALGLRRFARMFAETREMTLEDAIACMVSAADRLRGDEPQEDDWTLVLLEWG